MKFRLLQAWFLICTFTCSAQTIQSGNGLFDSEDVLEISLEFDITEFRKKRDDVNYMDATLTYNNQGEVITENLKLRARGKFRLKQCDMPPILLNFNDSSGGLFNGMDKIKMVTVCSAGNPEYLLKEYTVYKLYNIMTPESYRVRLLRVNYINSVQGSKPLTEYAFIMEPDEVLAKRIGGIEVKTTNLTQKNVIPALMDRTAIFNYMIGNTDWSVPIDHNIKLYAMPASREPHLAVCIPYDFDFSGLVDTHYSSPFPSLGLSTVRERMYLGMCRDRKTFAKALEEFSQKEQDFYRIINQSTWLDERSKNEMTYYLNTFFMELENPEEMVKTILRECLKF